MLPGSPTHRTPIPLDQRHRGTPPPAGTGAAESAGESATPPVPHDPQQQAAAVSAGLQLAADRFLVPVGRCAHVCPVPSEVSCR